MKKIVLALVLFVGSYAQAGFAPTDECSNLNATIKIDLVEGVISVLEDVYPEHKYIELSDSDVLVKETVTTQLEETTRGQTSTKTRFSKISLSMKDGSSMPDAYNILAKDGKLVDDFVCSERSAW